MFFDYDELPETDFPEGDHTLVQTPCTVTPQSEPPLQADPGGGDTVLREQQELKLARTVTSQRGKLNTDEAGTLRGNCKSCDTCHVWQLDGHEYICFRSTTAGPSYYSGGAKQISACKNCGCPSSSHTDLTTWFLLVQRSVEHFRDGRLTRRLIPAKSTLPVDAQHWDARSAALHVLTCGHYDPDLLCSSASCFKKHSNQTPAGLVSVCVPTSTKRHAFHPLVYKNFVCQTYDPKELVVIDIGEKPSPFFEAQARIDKQIVYRWFPVTDSTTDKDDARHGSFSGKYEPSPNTWSLGMKRNIAAQVASGFLIAHFDDDDLYAACYLQYMVDQLIEVAGQRSEQAYDQIRRGEGVAIATLSEWHTLDWTAHTFRWLDPKKDPSVLHSWRQDMIYGYGFSYLYTRDAWNKVAFPDTETSEDDIFMRELRFKHNALVRLVQLPCSFSGLVAHSFHSDCTSGGERDRAGKLLGQVIPSPPCAFADIMPLVKEINQLLPKPVMRMPMVRPLRLFKHLYVNHGHGRSHGQNSGKVKRYSALHWRPQRLSGSLNNNADKELQVLAKDECRLDSWSQGAVPDERWLAWQQDFLVAHGCIGR